MSLDGSAPSEASGEAAQSDEGNAAQFLQAMEESVRQRERYLQLEFKAKKAYECALNISKPAKGLDETLRDEIGKALNEAQMAELSRQLNLDPPAVDLVPYLLQLAQHGLLDALPPRHQSRVAEEFRASMGVHKEASGEGLGADITPSRISVHIRTIIQKVIEYGAPSRTEEIETQLMETCNAIDQRRPTLGDAVASCFRFVFSSIKQLHEDIAQYTLLMVSQDLKTNAVAYIRNFIAACLPPRSGWTSTIQFLHKYMRSEEVSKWVDAANNRNPSALTPTQLRLQGALLFGAIDLLRSARRNASNRWAGLPTEAFYFDRAVIFEAANAVQESTLLILLEGAVSSIFKGKGGSSADTNRMLYRLHAKILSLFSADIRLDDLKREVVSFTHKLLAECGDDTKVLSAGEEQMVCSIIEKMADTEGPLYISFENKVITFVSKTVRQEEDIPPLGLVTPSLTHTTEILTKGLSFNWEVYLPYYIELISLGLLD